MAVNFIRRPRPRRVPPPPNHPPNFSIVVLGLSGAGKTVFLASQFAALKGYAPQRPFRLVTDPHSARQLMDWHHTVADRTRVEQWPSGTDPAGSRTFRFVVEGKGRNQSYPLFRFDYHEYAGELLTDTSRQLIGRQQELENRISSANALLGIIDGAWLRRHFDGDDTAAMELSRTLGHLVLATNHIRCPLNLIITKWDLLNDIDRDDARLLRRVRSVLGGFPDFAALSRDDRWQRMRLIPVSSVGPGFAKMDENGAVVKARHGVYRPTRVTTPIASLIPDWLTAWQTHYRESLSAAEADDERSDRQRARAALFIRLALQGVAGFIPGSQWVQTAGQAVVGEIANQIRTGRRPQPEPPSENDILASDIGAAIEKTLAHMDREVESLAAQLPATRLNVDVP